MYVKIFLLTWSNGMELKDWPWAYRSLHTSNDTGGARPARLGIHQLSGGMHDKEATEILYLLHYISGSEETQCIINVLFVCALDMTNLMTWNGKRKSNTFIPIPVLQRPSRLPWRGTRAQNENGKNKERGQKGYTAPACWVLTWTIHHMGNGKKRKREKGKTATYNLKCTEAKKWRKLEVPIWSGAKAFNHKSTELYLGHKMKLIRKFIQIILNVIAAEREISNRGVDNCCHSSQKEFIFGASSRSTHHNPYWPPPKLKMIRHSTSIARSPWNIQNPN